MALVGTRRDAESGKDGFSTTGQALAETLGVTDRTIRNARRQACEDGLLAEEGVAGRATIRLWLGPRFRGASEAASEAASEVGSEDASESPGPAIDLNPILEAASDESEPRNLARAHARAPRRRQETGDLPQKDETSSTGSSRDAAPARDAVVVGADPPQVVDLVTAAQVEALTPAGEGSDVRDAVGDPLRDVDDAKVAFEQAKAEWERILAARSRAVEGRP